ncbi:MAG: PA-phosphatase [Cytophagaceae bacterium SCN 52-12]|nr:MAG: PA-phosphatase [Cytophagaceae bacterium SCN 52-12]
MKRAVFLLLMLLPGAARGQADSSRIDLKVGHTIAPVTLTLAGFAVQGKISRQLQSRIVSRYPDFHTTADNYLWATPAALTFGLSASGVKGKHKLGEQVLLFLISNAIAGGANQVVKWVSKYPRPDGDGYHSFASGHTAIAFANAGILHEEYGHRSAWYSIGGYANATAVGGLRLLNNRHWLADVLTGAGIGIGATKGVYLVYPWAKHKLHKK